MVRARFLHASFVTLLLTASLLAQSIPNWTAPRFWTPPRSPALEKLEHWRAAAALGAEGLPTGPLPFFGITPCRLLDTRPPANNPLDGDGIYGADEIRTYTLPGACGLPAGIQAVSLNVTATNTGAGAFGHVKVWPADGTEPNVSTLNYPGAGATVANAAVVPLSSTGAIKVKSGNTGADLILDVNGYYAPASTANAKTVAVDCTKGQSLQAAINREDGPLVVEVHGICNENVSVKRKEVTLRGANPATDGIQGVVATPQFPALRFTYVDLSAVENLSISNGPVTGFVIFHSRISMTNCRLNGNGGQGMFIQHSTVNATELTVSTNAAAGVVANVGGSFFCLGCHFENNLGFAATAINGGFLTLNDSIVTGRRALLANGPSYADIDCISSTSKYPCGLNVTGRAAQALLGATVGLYGAGDFTGQVEASDRAIVELIGARQLATGQPGQGPLENLVDSFGTLLAIMESSGQSQLFGTTNVSGFGRLLLRDMTILAGSIECDSAGDAWLDPTIVDNPGSSITGCEHGALPP